MAVRTCCVVALMLTVSSAVSAQGDPRPRDGWVLHLTSSGGFLGRGDGAFTLTSDGHVACTDVKCQSDISGPLLSQIADALEAIPPAEWVTAHSTCADCFRWKFQLRREDASGTTIYIAEWDDAASVPKRLLNLARLVKSLRR